MKRQLIEKRTESPVITLRDLEDRDERLDEFYYGVKPADNQKGFISRVDYDSGTFRVYAIDTMTRGNYWDSYNSTDLKSILVTLLGRSKEVFVFDTPQELLKWLSEP
jgi:hypothetical protein